jgi:ribonuclease G
MSKELIVSAGRHETRVAILEDDQVVELFHEREKEYSLAGSIHKGRVTRVLPGMQSAFVDIGLDRDAFLYVSDFFEDNDEYDAVVSTVEDKILKMETGGSSSEAAPYARRVSSESPAGEIPAVAAPVLSERPPRPERSSERSSDRGGDHRHGGRPPERTLDRTADRPADAAGDRGPDNRGDGRGRRGRRRRGGRGSGLPDSKFFTPGSEPAAAVDSDQDEEAPAVQQVSYAAAVSQPSTHISYGAPASAEDFLVLPGESLAKYSPDAERIPEVEEPPSVPLVAETPAEMVAETAVEVEEEPAVENALPVEHPLAGFGSVPSWTREEKVEEAALEIEAAVAAEELADELKLEPAAEEPVAVAETEETGAEPVSEEPEEVAELESAESDMVEEGSPVEAATEPVSGESVEPGESVEEDEGPEPARSPVSLTAALREQGHRYPHRVSRRMRRKMRSDRPGEEGEKPTQAAAGPAEVEEQTVAVPVREERPIEPRQERQERQERPPRERAERVERVERERPPLPSISDLLKEGQEIVVQIAKEPLGQKGARITSHIALPGRFVVYMPTVEHVGVSRKIPSDEERQRLKRVLQTHRQGVPGGFICRTAAEGKTEEELRVDMHFLYNLWLDMRQKAEKKPAPVLLHHDLDLVQRILRDQLTTSFKTIWVDNEELYESVLRFVQRFQPALVGRVKLYTRTNPIFDEFGITNEVEKALRPKVWLKSGGYIVINQTEALVAIDINTGKYVGKSNRLEDTIVKINTDAIKEIVRQIRLRDLGGIIVVDFIDMDERKNRQKVMMALEEGMRADRAPYKILQFNDFGLVAITRKRVKQSLERTLCAPCPYCEGAGYIKSVGTVVSEILQEAARMQKALRADTGNVVLRVNPEVAKILKSNANSFLQELEEIAGRTVMVKSDPLLHQTKFDLA